MKRSAFIKYLVLILSLSMIISLFACDNNEEPTETESPGESETVTDTPTQSEQDTQENTDGESDTESDTVSESEDATESETTDETVSETESVSETETLTESATESETVTEAPTESESESEEETECYHPYAADEAGHWKPACDKCGKGVGRTQSHEYAEKIDDGGDLWLYSFRCKICKYVAYEQEVPYEINSFFSSGELAGVDTDNTFSGNFMFEMGTGFAAYSMSSSGNGYVQVVENEDMDMESGRYVVMKVRLPGSQSRFSVAVKSICADNNYSMVFDDLKPGWVTIIADMTKAVDVDNKGANLGYYADANGEYYLGYLSVDCRVVAEEHFDIAYIMICDTLEEAEAFTANEKQVYTYHDIKNESPVYLKRDCVDKDGNKLEHTFDIDENGHTVNEPCYQCGLPKVEDAPHTYTQMRVDGELTYACSVCEHLQYGALINKIISTGDIHSNAITYYKVNRTDIQEENGTSYANFTGRGETAQIIFARNNSLASAVEKAAAFPISRGDLFLIRMRTSDTSVDFSLYFRSEGGVEKSVRLPLGMAEAGEWVTFAIDLSTVLPLAVVADENGEYKITSLYYQIGTYSVKSEDGKKNGADFTSSVSYDFEYMAFVDNWEELKVLVKDETVIKVNASNLGAEINTQKQECLGDHIWGEAAEGNTYKYLCANCETPVKIVELPESVKRYFSGYEIVRNAVTYSLAGTRSFIIDDDLTPFGRMKDGAEVWWARSQADYPSGNTGAALDVGRIDVGAAKYFVVRLRITDSSKYFSFYLSTTGKNGDGYSVSADGTVTKPTTSGMVTMNTPVAAAKVGEWVTYVFDLETLIPEYYVKDAESGTYILDTFAITYASGADFDVDYMAFVEGGWADIDALTDDETVVSVTHYKDKTYTVCNTADGSVKE